MQQVIYAKSMGWERWRAATKAGLKPDTKGRSLNLLLITDHDHDTISEDGVSIKVVTAREWLFGLY